MCFATFFWKIQIPQRRRVVLNPSSSLPASQDETKLPKGDYRSSMPSFCACFKSIFQICTETGNIWTHLLGFVLSLCLGILTMLPSVYFMASLQEKVVFGMLFLGAVLSLSFSWLFHITYCHLEKVLWTFSILDYSGIALLVMGELCYSFYCSPQPRLIYITCILDISAITEPQPIWDCSCSGPWVYLVIKNPVSDHLPVGCVKIGTSFAASQVSDLRQLVPAAEPVVIVVGAFAHGSVNVDYTEKMVSISNYPLSAALTCAKITTAFEEVWGVV